VDGNHVTIVKRIEDKVNGLIKGILEKQLAKKRPNASDNAISNFLLSKIQF
jgi:hypothetical protein